uniref:Phospholipid-transporting ATPase n=1 Tax=Cucumis melo TaxID=3656 RepID=A0A9I9CDL4_CUCME
MGSGRRRRKQHFRRIHAFPCGRASFKDEHSLIGGPGFSRVVYCNDPDSFEASLLNYGGNYVKTSKYTVASFFPKSLFEQFRRSAFINQDQHMYHEETDKPAHARTSNLNEELGQVDTILSDKTGTLTCNSMEFIKCSVGGTAYGRGITEVERALARRKESTLPQKLGADYARLSGEKTFVKGFNFKDERIMDGNWVNEPRANVIQKFLQLLAICHTALPEIDEETGKISYEAESPDEAAFVIAAREFGFEFYERTQTSISLREFDPTSAKKVERSYQLLDVLEFNSTRKRMSVIVRDAKGKLLLLCKGADSVMFERLAKNGSEFEEQTKVHINEYADAGLRTLVLAYRELKEEEFNAFHQEFIKAKNTAFKTSVAQQITDAKALLTSSSETPETLALIIDGKSLTYALEDDVKDLFLELAIGCASVICCRSSPKQKALVTQMVKVKTGNTTLAVGDGANDVGMIQEADIGIGISGVEGMQAVMSSDIAIAQFRYLERLLLVHGHWCYRRISSMICYFFYKNIVFGFTLFFFEMYASFSGQTVYNDWFLSLYNVFFTSLPVIALGVFDQDVSSRYCLKFSLLYQEGVQNVLFSWVRIFGWVFNGLLSSVIIFFFCVGAMDHQAFRNSGEVVGLEILGATMYTCVVWVVNCQMALSISYFTYIQHLFIWGSIILWYLFLMAYGAINPAISTTAFQVFIEACAPAPSFWILTLLALGASLLPYFVFSSIQMRFFPMYHQMIQWIKADGQSNDPEYCQVVRQRSLRHTTVGYTARFEASKHFEEFSEIKSH